MKREKTKLRQAVRRLSVCAARLAEEAESGAADVRSVKELAALLRELCKMDFRWMRLHYLYPDEFTDELIDTIAAEDKDYASSNMLVWFVDEQVEEEESAREMITACEAVEGNKFGLYMIDKELAARTYKQASPLATANA